MKVLLRGRRTIWWGCRVIPLARRIVNDLSCCLAPLHIIQRSSTSTRSIWYQCRFRFCASSITCRFSAVRTPGNACAAMGCVLPCRNQIPKRMASLCSACATVGCALPSSQAHALERRYPAVRAPLWAAHCLRCIRMLKNFVASERVRLSAVRPPQMDLCTESRALISFSLVEKSAHEAERAWLVRQPPKGLPWLIMKSKGQEVENMKTVAEALLQEQPKIQEELRLMWQHLNNVARVPIAKRDDMHPLYQLQFFLFLHMLSILLHGCASLCFGVSACFLDAVGQHFWFRMQFDILELVARYLYALWSSPAVDAEAWNQGFYGFFIPNNQMRACIWWKSMQEAILSQSGDVFCEEYFCVTRSVAADGREFAKEIEEILFRYRRSPVRVIPQVPHFHYWISHDALSPCSESAVAPRILQPFRSSSFHIDGTWGQNDGKPGNLRPENLVSEPHGFLHVEAPLPSALTLSQLMGPMMRRLADSYHAAGFGCPWWVPRTEIRARHPIFDTKVPEGDSLYYSETLEYQMLGALFMSAFRPDNVMHPHLRCHFEFHVGKLLAVEIYRGTLDAVTVVDFMAGCGVCFTAGEGGWLEEKLEKRKKVGTEPLTLYAHCMWGAKCRVQRYIDAEVDIIYMIPSACHIHKVCANHLQLCGYGCICNGYHGFTERYARQLMFHALQYLGCAGVESRGLQDAARGADDLGFAYDLMGQLGLHCPKNEQYHVNPDRRLQLFHLPKWAPKFLGEIARANKPPEELETWPPCQMACFLKKDVEAAREAQRNQTRQFQAFENLTLQFDKNFKKKDA